MPYVYARQLLPSEEHIKTKTLKQPLGVLNTTLFQSVDAFLKDDENREGERKRKTHFAFGRDIFGHIQIRIKKMINDLVRSTEKAYEKDI